eukprot:5993257-Amphidinium_carterae.4
MTITKVPTKHNPADVLTKHLPATTSQSHLEPTMATDVTTDSQPPQKSFNSDKDNSDRSKQEAQNSTRSKGIENIITYTTHKKTKSFDSSAHRAMQTIAENFLKGTTGQQ